MQVPKNPRTHLFVSFARLFNVVLQNLAILVRDIVGFILMTLSTIFDFSNGCTHVVRGGDGVTAGVKSKGRLGGVCGYVGGLAMSSNLRFVLGGVRKAAGTSAWVMLLSLAVILSIMFLNSARVV